MLMPGDGDSVLQNARFDPPNTAVRISDGALWNSDSYPNNSITPRNGIRTHSGRLLSSYTISYSAFSIR